MRFAILSLVALFSLLMLNQDLWIVLLGFESLLIAWAWWLGYRNTVEEQRLQRSIQQVQTLADSLKAPAYSKRIAKATEPQQH